MTTPFGEERSDKADGGSLLPPFLIVRRGWHNLSASAHYSFASTSKLLPPFLTTVQTPDEDCHGFICRPGLHFPVSRLRLTTSAALEHV
jgi:hypothetical protein